MLQLRNDNGDSSRDQIEAKQADRRRDYDTTYVTSEKVVGSRLEAYQTDGRIDHITIIFCYLEFARDDGEDSRVKTRSITDRRTNGV